MSSVCDLGTIKSIIRGVDEPSFHTLISELIDDAEHSNSTKIFIDINTRDKCVIIGFEKSATEDQLNKMVSWNPTSLIQNSNNISTCGAGLKYYEFRVRGEQIHATVILNDITGKNIYMKSLLNSDVIYNSANSPDISETQFSEILKKKTGYVQVSDEIEISLENIFLNIENKYPFNPKTIIMSKHITNSRLLEWLNEPDNITSLETELINKYYEEIKTKKIQIYIKFPKDYEFKELGNDCSVDVIGTTIKTNIHQTEIYYVLSDFEFNTEEKKTKESNKLKKGTYILRINDKFINIKSSGNSTSRTVIDINSTNIDKLLLVCNYVQYTNSTDEGVLKKHIVGKSLEDSACGIFLKIGNKFIDSRPLPSSIVKRNLPGSKSYRGIIQLMNPEKTKMMLGIHGLKSDFNLGTMKSLEDTIKQCTIIYKNFNKISNGASYLNIDPLTYCEVKTTNQKTKKKSKPGYNYIRHIGEGFYKLGNTYTSNMFKRLFEDHEDIAKLKTDFKDENIFPHEHHYYVYISPVFNKSASTEQHTKEFLLTLQDVTSYDSKTGDDTREYFHCDNPESLQKIIKCMLEGVNK
jgi:hypothetical protein